MKTSRKKLRLITIILVSLLVITTGVFTLSKLLKKPGANTPETEPSLDVESSPGDVPVPVEADTAKMGDLVILISATGLARAHSEITICPKTSGQVVELPVNTGQLVHKDELLVKLEDREYRLALEEAKNQLLGAQVEFGILKLANVSSPNTVGRENITEKELKPLAKDTETLAKTGAVITTKDSIITPENLNSGDESQITSFYDVTKREDVMAYKSGLTKAKVALQRAELNLARTQIRAPISGYVADLQVAIGQEVSAGKECLKLVDLSHIDVNVQVLESEIGLVQEGRKAEVTVPAYPGEIFQGQVIHINPLVDPETRTTTVIVRLVNPHKKVLPGMFAYAKLEAQIFKNRFIVPKDAILLRDQRKLVFVIRAGLAKWCYVDTGLENEDYVEILDSAFDLKPGEMVITSGHYTLVHDAQVNYRKTL